MDLQDIDTTTAQPNGKFGEPIKTAFEKINGNNSTIEGAVAANAAAVQATNTAVAGKVSKSGDTLTGTYLFSTPEGAAGVAFGSPTGNGIGMGWNSAGTYLDFRANLGTVVQNGVGFFRAVRMNFLINETERLRLEATGASVTGAVRVYKGDAAPAGNPSSSAVVLGGPFGGGIALVDASQTVALFADGNGSQFRIAFGGNTTTATPRCTVGSNGHVTFAKAELTGSEADGGIARLSVPQGGSRYIHGLNGPGDDIAGIYRAGTSSYTLSWNGVINASGGVSSDPALKDAGSLREIPDALRSVLGLTVRLGTYKPKYGPGYDEPTPQERAFVMADDAMRQSAPHALMEGMVDGKYAGWIVDQMIAYLVGAIQVLHRDYALTAEALSQRISDLEAASG